MPKRATAVPWSNRPAAPAQPVPAMKRTDFPPRSPLDGLAVRGDAGERLADGQRVDFLGALVCEYCLKVVRVPDRRVFERHAAGSEHCPGLPGDVDGRPDIGHLGDTDLHGAERALLLE